MKISIRMFLFLALVMALGTALGTGLLMNSFERKVEGTRTSVRLVEATEDDKDPEKWAAKWPPQYD